MLNQKRVKVYFQLAKLKEYPDQRYNKNQFNFKDLALFVNNNDNSSILRSTNNNDSISYFDPLYQYQQSTIDMQKRDIDIIQQKYNKLLANYNDLKIEFEELKRSSNQSETKLDELSQTIEIEVPESIKTHIRIQ